MVTGVASFAITILTRTSQTGTNNIANPHEISINHACNKKSKAIRVGTKKGGAIPSYKGYKRVVCLMPSSAYGDISPYTLKDEKGRLLENVWQFSKIYDRVPRSVQRYSRYDKRVIWEHTAETHVESGIPNEKYFAWREKGMNHGEAVRYPVGFKHRSKCICAYKSSPMGPLTQRLR